MIVGNVSVLNVFSTSFIEFYNNDNNEIKAYKKMKKKKKQPSLLVLPITWQRFYLLSYGNNKMLSNNNASVTFYIVKCQYWAFEESFLKRKIQYSHQFFTTLMLDKEGTLFFFKYKIKRERDRNDIKERPSHTYSITVQK